MRAAAISSHEWEDELEAFACGNHYHIGHSDPAKWGKLGGDRQNFCDACKQEILPKNWQRHVLTGSHKKRVIKEKAQER